MKGAEEEIRPKGRSEQGVDKTVQSEPSGLAIPTNISGDRVKKVETDGLCGMYVVEQKCIQLFEKGEGGYLKETN